MEILLTLEQQAQLLQIAAFEGKGVDELAREVLARGLKAEVATLTASRKRNPQGYEAAAPGTYDAWQPQERRTTSST